MRYKPHCPYLPSWVPPLLAWARGGIASPNKSVPHNSKNTLRGVAFCQWATNILTIFFLDEKIYYQSLKNAISDSEKISELINSKIIPLPRYELNTYNEENKDFIEIKVGDGPRTPYYYENDGRKEAFVRAGNESIPAPKHLLDNLILKGQNTTFDELPSKYDINDVSFNLLNASLKRETGREINKEKDYVSLELMTKDNAIKLAGREAVKNAITENE